MFNLSDKELDRLSREASEKFEVAEDPGFWLKLEQLLDKELGRSSPLPKFSGRARPFFYAPLAVLLVGSLYFLLKPEKHTTNSTPKNIPSVANKNNISALPANEVHNPAVAFHANGKTETPTAHTEGMKKDAVAPPDATNDCRIVTNGVLNKGAAIPSLNHEKANHALNTRKAVNLPNMETASSADRSKSGSIHSTEALALHDEASSSHLTNKPNNASISHRRLSGNAGVNLLENSHLAKPTHNLTMNGAAGKNNQRNGSRNHRAGAGKVPKEKMADNPMVKEMESEKIVSATISLHTESVSIWPVVTIGLQPVVAKNIYSIDDSVLSSLHMNASLIPNPINNNKNRTLTTNRSLVIGLLYSPDFSKVRYDYQNKIGSNIGITLGYQLSNKLLINTGLIFSHKNYNLAGEDFHCPAQLIGNIHDVEFVEASSHILEIPLNLRYDFAQEGNTSFFINGGLSSYIMKKENYWLFYHGNYGGGFLITQDYGYNTNQMNWFPILNLSAGFETKISNSFSFQLEPYMKLPLAGIGVGNVNLTSYGINASFQFEPLLKRSRH